MRKPKPEPISSKFYVQTETGEIMKVGVEKRQTTWWPEVHTTTQLCHRGHHVTSQTIQTQDYPKLGPKPLAGLLLAVLDFLHYSSICIIGFGNCLFPSLPVVVTD